MYLSLARNNSRLTKFLTQFPMNLSFFFGKMLQVMFSWNSFREKVYLEEQYKKGVDCRVSNSSLHSPPIPSSPTQKYLVILMLIMMMDRQVLVIPGPDITGAAIKTLLVEYRCSVIFQQASRVRNVATTLLQHPDVVTVNSNLFGNTILLRRLCNRLKITTCLRRLCTRLKITTCLLNNAQ